ncbi:DUF402 domain-containing protein [Streptomyces sp. NPDC087658]|uniref:DUF402 domain-containing protein n=1 Tax=Streptomyces sp. NPDC087658 TaxID=3365800 RepID=UPI0038143339
MDGLPGPCRRARRHGARRVRGPGHTPDLRHRGVRPGTASRTRIGSTWQSEGVLQLQRPGEGYAVWSRLRDGRFGGWYVNFQRPMRCTERGFDTLDQELDLLIPDADGSPEAPYRWKDEDEFEHRVSTGGFAPGEAESVRAAVAQVAGLVERGEGWWDAWRDWRAPHDWAVPPRVPLSGRPES